MVSKTCVIQNPTGLHARPATLFVQKATSFPAEVFLTKGTKRANGKSIMGLMTLGLAKGDEVLLEVDGQQENEALAELAAMLETVYE
ncbi:HPr family phosphocarrier protein [Brevibacillus fulvus]|uniref:Phosphocarrier protein HPr n=1 Tax=Brevibacillus fulvus TaxID=1125967 RepID=A0A938XY23_9BACL|nr:HPr family phosphocarrier protein [Brevibacillus fulvus]MBM7590274.1 phosphocarrier protein [Brevibacillus fulvus]